MPRSGAPRWSFVLLAASLACGPGASNDSDPGTTDGTTSTSDPSTTTPTPPTTSTGTGTTAQPTTTGLDTGDTGTPDVPEFCSLLEQDCPPGFKCNLFFEGGSYETRCVEVVDDPNAEGEPCSVDAWPPDGDDDCDATSTCWDPDENTLMGECWSFCVLDDGGDTVCPDPCDHCAIGGDNPPLCVPTCDPLMPSCAPGEVCIPANEVFACVPQMDVGAVTGDPCLDIGTCPADHACIGQDFVPGCVDLACCSPYCDPSDDFDPCPGLLPGTFCVAIYEPGEEPLPECGYSIPGVCASMEP